MGSSHLHVRESSCIRKFSPVQKSTARVHDVSFLPPADKPKRHELSVSTYQMCLLLCFNGVDHISYSELLAQTKIPVDELKRHLQSMYVNEKCKILVKQGGNPNESMGSTGSSKKEPQEGTYGGGQKIARCQFFVVLARNIHPPPC